MGYYDEGSPYGGSLDGGFLDVDFPNVYEGYCDMDYYYLEKMVLSLDCLTSVCKQPEKIIEYHLHAEFFHFVSIILNLFYNYYQRFS